MLTKLKCKACKRYKIEYRLPQRKDKVAICNECYVREVIKVR